MRIATVEAQGIFLPGEAGNWVDPHSYTHFWYGKAAGWIGIGLTVSWVFIASSKKKENKNG